MTRRPPYLYDCGMAGMLTLREMADLLNAQTGDRRVVADGILEARWRLGDKVDVVQVQYSLGDGELVQLRPGRFKDNRHVLVALDGRAYLDLQTLSGRYTRSIRRRARTGHFNVWMVPVNEWPSG